MKRSTLAAAAVILIQCALVLGDSIGRQPQLTGDSLSYLDYSPSNLTDALGNFRTFGYPIFIKINNAIFGNLESLPLAQTVLGLCAVITFWLSLHRFGLSIWSATVAASPLFYCPAIFAYSGFVLTDSPGMSLAIISLSGVVAFCGKDQRGWLLAAIAVFAFYSMQVRPSFMLLAVQLPLLALGLRLLKNGWSSLHDALGFGLKIGAASFLPFLAFGLLRLAVVGNFGLVSFTGVTSTSISVEILNRKNVMKMPPRIRPFALAVLRERNDCDIPRAITYGQIDTDLPAQNESAWRMATPMARRFGDQSWVKQDRRLTEFSKASIKNSKEKYLLWLYAAAVRAGTETLSTGHGWKMVAAILMAMITAGGILFSAFSLSDRISDKSGAYLKQCLTDISTILMPCLLIMLPTVLLTIMVQPPRGRYIGAASVLLPSLLAICAWSTLTLGVCLYLLPGIKREEENPKAKGGASFNFLLPILKLKFIAPAVVVLSLLAVAMLYKKETLPPLLAAIDSGEEKIALRMLNEDATRARQKSGEVTALHLAALNSSADMVARLIEKGCDIEGADSDGLTPLHWAALAGNAEACRALLAKSADPNSQNIANGITPLHLADNPAVVKSLVDAGAYVNARDWQDSTPLHWAASNAVVEALLECGANPNLGENRLAVSDEISSRGNGNLWHGFTPLNWAIYRGQTARVKLLLKSGADADMPDAAGLPPLAHAIENKDIQIVRLLLAANANPGFATSLENLGDASRMTDPLLRIVYQRLEGEAQNDSVTPLHWAAFRGNTEAIRELVRAGADINRLSRKKRTALHWAALGNRADTAAELLRLGVDAQVTDMNKETAKDLAGRLGNYHTTRILDRNGG